MEIHAQQMHILAIETTCDETAASVISGSGNGVVVRSNVVSSQVQLHAQWGGVVPNLAAREHTKNIIPVLTEALDAANINKGDVDMIAVAHCPGLIPALLSGVSAAKTLAYAWRKPLIGIHHIEGHIYANWISHARNIAFPVLALVVSGGHTQLILMDKHCSYKIIGETQDDAVGEAFDKVARILGLGYPGGPKISACAQNFSSQNMINDIKLPQPMLHSNNYHFSFSGLKTAVLYLVKDYRTKNHLHVDDHLPQTFIDRVAHAFQTAVVRVLTEKTMRAVQEYNAASLLLAGGVSANAQLRHACAQYIEKHLPHVFFATPNPVYCIDNAAMIATAAYYHYGTLTQEEKTTLDTNWKTLQASAQCSLGLAK